MILVFSFIWIPLFVWFVSKCYLQSYCCSETTSITLLIHQKTSTRKCTRPRAREHVAAHPMRSAAVRYAPMGTHFLKRPEPPAWVAHPGTLLEPLTGARTVLSARTGFQHLADKAVRAPVPAGRFPRTPWFPMNISSYQDMLIFNLRAGLSFGIVFAQPGSSGRVRPARFCGLRHQT